MENDSLLRRRLSRCQEERELTDESRLPFCEAVLIQPGGHPLFSPQRDTCGTSVHDDAVKQTRNSAHVSVTDSPEWIPSVTECELSTSLDSGVASLVTNS